MEKLYYLDTSIWLDFFEQRDKPNLPKGEWAHVLIGKIIEGDGKILYSDSNLFEIKSSGYSIQDIHTLFRPLRSTLIFVRATKKQLGKAKDLAAKRKIPKRDALHALISRDHNATLVTLDKHFQKLIDITKYKTPKELI